MLLVYEAADALRDTRAATKNIIPAIALFTVDSPVPRMCSNPRSKPRVAVAVG
jgi:hypothetical protein